MSLTNNSLEPSCGIYQIKQREHILVSFEVMPPRTEAAVKPFFDNLKQLLAIRPDFVSVTYGAGGKDRTCATDLVSLLVADSFSHPMAHLTTVGATRDEISAVIESYFDVGVRTFLALRGDPPADCPDWVPGPYDVRSAAELISLIKLIQARRIAGYPGLALRQAIQPLTIAVATFVEGNPQANTTIDQEIDNLLIKQEAGANLAITQIFWKAEAYAYFVHKARHAGVHIPIVPGVMPIESTKRILRTQELIGVAAPEQILHKLNAAKDPFECGINIGAKLIKDLLSLGAPSIHVFTMNKARPALALLARAGLIDTSRLLPECDI